MDLPGAQPDRMLHEKDQVLYVHCLHFEKLDHTYLGFLSNVSVPIWLR